MAKAKREIAPRAEHGAVNVVDVEMDWLVRKFFTHLWHNDHGSDTDLQRAVNLVDRIQKELDRLRKDERTLQDVRKVVNNQRTIPRSA